MITTASPLNRAAEAMGTGVTNRLQHRDFAGDLGQNLAGAIRGTVVNDDDFVVDAPERKFKVQIPHRRCNAALLVTRGDDDAQLFKPGAIHGVGAMMGRGRSAAGQRGIGSNARQRADRWLTGRAACS